MENLVHGGDIYTAMEQGKTKNEILDYSANLNPLGMPEGVKEAIVQSLCDCGHYPDPLCRKLRRALAEQERVPPEFLIFGNGAADLIFRLPIALKPRQAMILDPGFAEYENALRTADCRILHYRLKEEDGFVLTKPFLSGLKEELDLLFLCNPNNPTGRLIPQALLRDILCRCEQKQILAVVDECFIDFVEEPEKVTVKHLVKDHPSLFVLRAFTKNYALAGMRLGYGICGNERVLEQVSAAGQPWSVSFPAQEAGIQALRETQYLKEARNLVFREKKRLIDGLSALGYRIVPPAANYILFKLKDVGTPSYVKSFAADMAEEGILIRNCANYKGLGDGYFRIAVKTEPENRRLLETLKRREEAWQKRL